MMMLRLEFHCHTHYSRDSLTDPAALVKACQRKGIDRLVITDHNTIAGALAAQKIDPQRVIIGEEILTTHGELLAAFVSEEVPAGLSPQETIRRLRAQGAFISVSHPFDWLRHGWRYEDLLAATPSVDAIEVFNARCWWPGFNRRAQKFALQHGLAGTVGSDAHTVLELGRATLFLPPFTDPDGLREALKQARYQVRWSGPWVHLSSRYASLRKGEP